MGMRLRRLHIQVETTNGPYGVIIPFEIGMNVIRADNSSGKSTCMMAILYGLGLEGMLGPSHRPPFAEVMFESLLDGELRLKISESYVRLEIENDRGEVLTTKRFVSRDIDIEPNKSRQLVQVSEGSAVSQPSEDRSSKDYFVRVPEAATSELGFHRRLAEFLGFELPSVPGTDHAHVRLYLECLFPFFFVDQLSGWRDLKARMPTYLQIPEMAKRSTEFVLSLDILEQANQRQTLTQREEKLRHTWRNRLVFAQTEIQGKGVMLNGFPENPVDRWPPKDVTPNLMCTDGANWRTIEAAIRDIQSRVHLLSAPKHSDAQRISPEWDRAYLQRLDVENQLAEVCEQIEENDVDNRMETMNLRAIDKRLRALGEELRDYRETKAVLDRGGFVELKTSEGICPTCRQQMKDTLLPQDRPNAPMSLEDNIHYIKDEYDTYEQMRKHTLSTVESRQTMLGQLRHREAELFQTLRELRKTLVAPLGTPSVSEIGEQIRLEHEVDRLRLLGEWYEKLSKEFDGMAAEYAKIKADRQALGEDVLSDLDKSKIANLEASFREQLTSYGFRSFKVDEISLSPINYRPTRHGFDIGLTSASDAIRLIWAYLLSFLEVERLEEFHLNHLGMIVFDEPKQQNAQDISLKQLLKRAAKAIDYNQQVIVATSEESSRLAPMLKGIECKYLDFPKRARILKKLT